MSPRFASSARDRRTFARGPSNRKEVRRIEVMPGAVGAGEFTPDAEAFNLYRLVRTFYSGGSTLKAWDVLTDSWSDRETAPATDYSSAATAANPDDGLIHMMGGTQTVTGRGNWAYNPTSDTWLELTPLPLSTGSPCGAYDPSHRQLVYFGGSKGGGNPYTALDLYDLDAGTWSAGAPPPVVLREGGAVYTNGAVYGLAGMAYAGSSWSTTRARLLRYDPAADSWMQLADRPTAARDNALATRSGRLYALGGYDGSAWTTNFDVYDTAISAWGTAPDMPAPIEDPRAAFSQGYLHVVGIHPGQGNTVHYVYNPEDQTWDQKPQPYTASPGDQGSMVSMGV